MKIKTLILLTLAFSICIFSCKKAPLTIGKTITESRPLDDFNKVYINDDVSVTLVKSDSCWIEITTGENLMDNIIVNVPRGEQAPPANPGQRNFGGMMPMGGSANRARTPRPQGQAQGQAAQRPAMQMPAMQRPTPQVRTVSLKELSMSDPFIYPDPETKTYWLTGTGG